MMRTALRWLFGLAFVGAGINHFVNPAFYVAIMPPYLPAHELLVAVSGVAEVLIGALVCVERARPWSGYLAIALLVAVFPANVHMALHPSDYPAIPSLALYVRLPLQAVMIGWAWWATRRPA